MPLASWPALAYVGSHGVAAERVVWRGHAVPATAQPEVSVSVSTRGGTAASAVTPLRGITGKPVRTVRVESGHDAAGAAVSRSTSIMAARSVGPRLVFVGIFTADGMFHTVDTTTLTGDRS